MGQSYLYSLIGTQPLSIISDGPNGTMYGGSDTVPVNLSIITDNGYSNGQATCYYAAGAKPTQDSSYIQFFETNATNQHSQRQDLVSGNYTYYFKCIDLGGNAAYNQTNFVVKTDKNPPSVIRVYKESGQLKIITNKAADCSYSLNDCNFDIPSGIQMTTTDYLSFTADWTLNQNYFIRCSDQYGNQPNPDSCTMVIKASQLSEPSS